MSILSNIFSKIFPSSHPAVVKPNQSTTPQSVPANAQPTPTTTTKAQSSAENQNITAVNVEEILNEKNKSAGQTLNWRTSIVDLLKLLDLDSSLQARKELAAELGYTGDTNDSATMNIWLHRQVMNKLAANGGKVPADLKD